MCKKFLSLFLAFALLIGQTPAVFAANDEVLDDPTVIVQEVTEDTTVIDQEDSEEPSDVQQEDSEEPSVDEQEVSDEPSVDEQEASDETSDVNGDETSETEADVSGEGADEPALTKTSFTVAPDPGLPGNDELFAAYAESVLYGYSVATFGTAAREELIGDEVVLYDALVPFIKDIAAGNRASAVIVVGQEVSDGETIYPVDAEATFESAEFAYESSSRVLNALLADYPYEMYWYDKTSGCEMWTIGTEDKVLQINVCFMVAQNYCGETMTSVDTAKTGVASKAAAVAQEIVAKYANSADLDKLYCYKQEICGLVSYNDEAAESGDFSVNNNPWQLIYVFDGDATTNVVCEGYSKAFMYLCDLSDFTGDVACYTVSGMMDDEAHMWNIVSFDGCNYLADVTNSDSGSIGQDGSLFLVTGEGSAADGYDVNGTSYVYDAETIAMWGLNPESILNLGANSGNDDSGDVEETLTSGSCGENLTWTLVDGVLTISGTGDMAEDTSASDAWFANVDNIESIVIEDGITSIAGYVFYGLYNVKEIRIPESVVTIGVNAFSYCESLESIELPNSITSISMSLFAGCSALKSIEIPDGVTEIGPYAFSRCSSLESISIPASVTSIGPAFLECSALSTVNYGGTQEDWNNITIDTNGENNAPLLNANIIFAEYEEETPHLFATWPGQNYNDNPFDGYEFYHNGTNSFDFWFGNSEEAIKVAYEDLAVTGIASISESWYWNEYDEQVTCVDVGTTGYGEGTVVYTVGEDTYEFPVSRVLPLFGFYESAERSEETCLDAVRAEAGEPVEFYFLWREDVSAPTGGIIVTDHNDNEIPVEFDVETGLVQMTAPEQSGYLNFAVELGHEWTYQGIDYINTAPRLFATWSGESYQDGFFESYEMNDSSNYSFEFWFGTAESAVRVPFEDLTVTGVASISEGGWYEEDGKTITRVNVSTTGFGTGAVEYTVGEKTYKFLLSRVLPDYGFYSSDVRSGETYLEQLRGEANQTMEFYFLTEDGNSPVESMTAMDNYGNAIPVEFDSETGLVKMTAPKNSVLLRFKAVYGGNLGWYWIDYVNTAPHLFAQRAGDESSDNYIEYFMAPSEYSGQIFHFYFGCPGNAVKVDVSDLNAEGVANITENTYEDYLGQEITACFVGASDFGEGAVVYTVDGVDYKFPVTGKLPDLGAYKANVLSEENYIDTYDTPAGEIVTVYLKGSGDFHEIYTITGVYGEYYDGNEWFDFDVTATPVGRDYEVTFVSPGYDVDLFAQMGDGGEYVSLHYTGETEEEEPDVITDTCGENLTWEFVVETGVLTISGTGAMYDYAPLGENSENESPFSGADVITSVIVNEGVTYIGSNAFEGCNMTLIQLPTTLETVGENAFKGWNGEFLCVMYPEGSVVDWLNVNLSSGNHVLFTAEMMLKDGGKIGEELYWQIIDGTLTFMARGEGSGMYESENGEPYEMPWAGYADQITKIDMQKGITIHDGAFAGLTNVTELTLPAYLLYFQDAIGDLTALEKIEIPADNAGGYEVIADGKALLRSNIEVEGTYTLYAVAPTVGEEFTIPTGVTCIHFNAFKNCANIKTLNIPASTTLVLPNAFSGCTALTTVNYDGSAEDWAAVEILDGNEALKNANIVFAEEETPSGTCGDNLTWTLVDGVLTISGTGAMSFDTDGAPWLSYANEITSLVLNEGITVIGDRAFFGCKSLTSVDIPASVTRIGVGAFASCSELTTVNLCEGLTVIDALAFNLCTKLSNITIPSTVETIGWSAFYQCAMESVVIPAGATIDAEAFSSCPNLQAINVDTNNPYHESIDGVLFTEDLTTLMQYPAAKSGAYIIPDSVTTIADNAFSGSVNLTSVIIPDTVTDIPFAAFLGCEGLTEVEIPKSVTSIGMSAFNLCTALTTVNYGGTESEWAKVTVGENNDPLLNANIVFAEEEAPSGVCGENLTWELKDGMLTISGTGAMYNYVSAADGGDNVSPFANSTEITGLIVEEGVTSIGGYAFEGCSMTLVQLPTTLEAVGVNAFKDWSGEFLCIMYPEGSVVDWLNISLSSGNHVLFTSEMMLAEGGKIGEELYWQIIDGTLTFMARGEGSGMYESENGEPYEMPWAEYADQITKIDMQKGITIHDGAFRGLTKVTELVLPASLLYFQDAIGDLPALEKIEIPADNAGGYEVNADGKAILRSNTETEGTYTLYAVAPTVGEEFTVPAGVTCIHFNAFKNCANLETLNIPASTTLVLPNAFSGCTALTTVNYGGTDADWAAVEILDGNEALTDAKINTKHVHTEVVDEAIAVTCTRAGVTEGKHCSDCGEVLVAQEVIPATGHYYDAGTVLAEPTCTADGKAVTKCTVCGHEITARNLDEILVRRLTGTASLIAAAPYYNYGPEYIINEIVWSYFVNYDQTWEFVVPAAEFEAEVGKYFKTDTMMIQMLREYAASLNPEYASVYYDAEFNTYTVRPVGGFGGSMDERQYVGYVKSGSEYTAYYCTINYVFLTEVMDDADSYAESLGYPETIEYEGQIFSNGPDGYYYIESIADSGRKVTMEFNDNVVRIVDVRDFTAAELPTAFDDVDGGKTGHLNDKDNDYFCDDCGADLCVSHILTAIPAVDATCTETGLTEGIKCEKCGKVLEQQEVVGALGHDLAEYMARTPSCTEPGTYRHYHCSRCEKNFDFDDPTKELAEVHYGEPTDHHYVVFEGKEPTCTEAGNLPYRYCDNSYTLNGFVVECNERFITIDGVEESWRAYTDDTAMIERAQLPATGHTEGDVMIENEIAATCTTAGSADYVVYCAECGEELNRETIEVPMTAHDVSYVEDKEATFTAAGCNEHYKCNDCGALFLDALDVENNKPCAKDKVILPQKVDVSAGKAEVKEEVMEEAISNSTDSTVNLPLTEAAEETKAAQLPVASLEKIKEADKELTVETNFAVVTMDNKALETIVEKASSADTIELVVEPIALETLKEKQQEAVSKKKVAAVISAEIIVNGDENISHFQGGTITVRIPFTPPVGSKLSNYTIIHIDDEGKVTNVPTKYENGYLVADLQHFSEYAIEDTHEHEAGDVVVEKEISATCTTAGSYDNVIYCKHCTTELNRETIPVPVIDHVDNDDNDKCDTCGGDMVKKLWGDADGNGRVNLRDAMLVLAVANKHEDVEINRRLCDVTGEGTINLLDAMWVLKRANQHPDLFPVEK